MKPDNLWSTMVNGTKYILEAPFSIIDSPAHMMYLCPFNSVFGAYFHQPSLLSNPSLLVALPWFHVRNG